MHEPSTVAETFTPDPGRRWGTATWTAAALYLLAVFDRGWIPHDEGTIAQTAWRVLLGELPHRDFDALYTGLLGFVNAGAMMVLGEHFLAPRAVLLVACLAWVAAVWSILTRFATPPLASAATLLCVTIGPAVYPAAMPSWYNLFLATGGVLALIHWTEDGRCGWLTATGALAGVSVLFKLTGLYLLAAALFTVLHVEVGRGGAARPDAERAGGAGRAMLVTLPVLALAGAVLLLVRSQLGPGAVVHYVIPTMVVGGIAARLAWSRPYPDRVTVARIARGWIRLTIAFSVPVAIFAAVFAAAGALDDLWRGLFVLPGRRVATAASAPLDLTLTAGIVVPLALLVVERLVGPARRGALALGTGAAGLALLVMTREPAVYRAVWLSVQPLVPAAVVAGGFVAVRWMGKAAQPSMAGAMVPVLWAAALTSLIQFPFAGPIYFAYAAPLGVVAAVGATTSGGTRRPDAHAPVASPMLIVLVMFYAAFMAIGPDRGGHFGPPTDSRTVPLAVERGRIQVTPSDAEEYGRLVATVRGLTRSETIYVTPDAPEVYFLSGLRNPTRTLFEIFDDPARSEQSIQDLLERHGVNVVVLNTAPHFSPRPFDLAERLERRYPRAERIGRFIVRWR